MKDMKWIPWIGSAIVAVGSFVFILVTFMFATFPTRGEAEIHLGHTETAIKENKDEIKQLKRDYIAKVEDIQTKLTKIATTMEILASTKRTN